MLGDRSVIATLNVVTEGLLSHDEASLSDAAWTLLGATEGARVSISRTECAPACDGLTPPTECSGHSGLLFQDCTLRLDD